MTTATAGTGTITLGSAAAGYLSFSGAGVSDADVVSYGIIDGSNSECGTGTYTSAGTTLTRTVTKSTNSDAAISLTGNAQVFITPRKEDILVPANNLSDVASVATALSNLTAIGQGRHTIWIPAAAMKSRTTNGAAVGAVEMATNKNMFNTFDFDTTTQEFVQFEIYFPKSWNLSTITFQPVWSHAATSTNFGVAFGLAGIARSNDDAGDVAFGTAQTSVDTGGTTNDIYVGPESSAITIGGTPAAEDTVQFQINRTVADGGDTMAIDARLHGIRLFYTINAVTDT